MNPAAPRAAKGRRSAFTAHERDELIAALKPIVVRFRIGGHTLGKFAEIAAREMGEGAR
jgi:hypothetical protein